MASAWVEKRETKKSGIRYVVRYRTGGRERPVQFGGSFRTQREARIRRDAIGGDLAALRVPDVRLLERPVSVRTLRAVSDEWRVSRVDVAEGTAAAHRVNLGRILPRLGDRQVEAIEPGDVAGLVAELAANGLARESIRKTLTTLAQALDFEGIDPNPVRDKRVKLPREDRREVAHRARSMSWPSTRSSRAATACRCSCWTRPECASASSST